MVASRRVVGDVLRSFVRAAPIHLSVKAASASSAAVLRKVDWTAMVVNGGRASPRRAASRDVGIGHEMRFKIGFRVEIKTFNDGRVSFNEGVANGC